MKTIIKLTLAAALTVGTFQALAQDDPLARLRAQRAAEQQQLGGGQPADAAPTPAPVDTAATAPAPAVSSTPVEAPVAVSEPMVDYTTRTSMTLSTNGITFNFRNASLNDVLTYMSDAAGFIIVLNTQINGRVNVISTHPMSKDEAVDLLNTVLNQNGLAAVRDGRTLTIMTKSDAIHAEIPVQIGNVATNISKSAEIVTQIIPIQFVDAQQLLVDISPFISSQATVMANTAGNSIVITDTKSNIRHLLQIISSIDSSAKMETEVRVFALKYANPSDVVTLLGGVFPSSGSGSTTVGRGGAAGGFAALFGGGGGGRGGGGGNTSQARVQKSQQVLAVADGRTQSVVVTAAKEMMPQIDEMIHQLDVDSTRDTDVSVLSVHNGDPYQVAAVLQQMFGSSTATRTGTTQTSPLDNRKTQMQNSTSTGGLGTSGGSGSRGGGTLF